VKRRRKKGSIYTRRIGGEIFEKQKIERENESGRV